MENSNIEIDKPVETEEIPEFFRSGYVERVVDALPYYFPNYLKERLKREHPDIPVTYEEIKGGEKVLDYYEREYLIPLYNGAHYLNEMLVESLSLSMLTEINDYIEVDTTYMEDLFNPFLSDYGRNNTTFELIQHMQVALLSGDFRQTNRYLKEKYNMTIYNLLSNINNKIVDEKYLFQQNEKDDCIISGTFYPNHKTIYIHPLIQENLSLTKKLLRYSKLDLKFARLIFSREAAKVASEEIQKYDEEKKIFYATIALVGIHETLHYLSYNPKEGRTGFKFRNPSNLYRLSQSY